MKPEKEDNKPQDGRSLYDLSIGKKINEVEEETNEAIQEQDNVYFQEWLNHPHTIQVLRDIKFNLGKSLDAAMAFAKIGNEQAALRVLIRASTIKEVIDYATRSNTKQ